MPLLLILAAAVLAAPGASHSAGLPASANAPGAPSQHPKRKVRAITIRAVPDPSTVGQPVTITGKVQGRHVGRIRVLLWRRDSNQSAFHLALSTRADADGVYTIALGAEAVRTNRLWYVSAGAVKSQILPQTVQAVLTLTASDMLPAPGERLTFRGHVSPWHGGDPIQLQRLEPGGWADIAQGKLDPGSNFSLARHFPRGPLRLRAVLPADARNAVSQTPELDLAVKDIHRIRHVVVIMQENRSFDAYFGTFPGADGIPAGVCVPDPMAGDCTAPYHDPSDQNFGGPHNAAASAADVDGGRMDGFVDQAERASGCGANANNPTCVPCTEQSLSGASSHTCIDVMGYHDAREVPNYWAYAHDYVLQDHLFEPNASWSLPQHLYMVSEWSANCVDPLDPFSCQNALDAPNDDGGYSGPNDGKLHYAWTDLTYLLFKAQISWGYYVYKGEEPDCQDPAQMSCPPVPQAAQTPGIWNPLPSFADVAQDGQAANVQSLSNFYAAAADGTLPAVSWVTPNAKVSEHPPALVSNGQAWVTGLVNAVMRGPDWRSTAILLTWDDWGGFYDHAVPPVADRNGFGLRVPGLLISPYARHGFIDHQILSHDAYNKFIEDDFLGGQRLDPATDGRPDPRIDVRESSPLVGDLIRDFDFSQSPRAPMPLPVDPPPGPASTPP